MMNVERFVVGPLETNAYVLQSGGESAVIDPAGVSAHLLESISGTYLRYVLLTHAHIDHFAGLDALNVADGIVGLHRDDMPSFSDPELNGVALLGIEPPSTAAGLLLEDGMVLNLGETSLTVLHTPGHTPGGICLLTDEYLFSGDTLFAGSVGRTDLPAGDGARLAMSLRRLAALDGDPVVYPGHGPTTSLQKERRDNFFLSRMRNDVQGE